VDLAIITTLAQAAESGTADAGKAIALGVGGGLGETDGAVHAVAVGQGEGVHAVLDGSLDQDVGVGGAVAQRVAGGDVEVDEGVARHGDLSDGSSRVADTGDPSAALLSWPGGRVGRGAG